MKPLNLIYALFVFALFLLSVNVAVAAKHQCAYCHTVHMAVGESLLNETNVEVLCLTCHGPGGISILKADVHTNKTGSSYPPFRISCRQCHNSHESDSGTLNWIGGRNIKITGYKRYTSTGAPADFYGYSAIIKTPSSGRRRVVFESRGTDAGQPSLHSFADSDEDANGVYDGICEVCHTATKHHKNEAPDTTHHTGATCTRCHLHTDNFNQ